MCYHENHLFSISVQVFETIYLILVNSPSVTVRNHTLTSVENQKRKKKIIAKLSIKVFKFYFILFFLFLLKGEPFTRIWQS